MNIRLQQHHILEDSTFRDKVILFFALIKNLPATQVISFMLGKKSLLKSETN
jgi:hypothetical protein